MARRTNFGKELITGQWAFAEFDALAKLWQMGLPVPYPVQLDESEMLMEFIGAIGPEGPIAAPTTAPGAAGGGRPARPVGAVRGPRPAARRGRVGARRPLPYNLLVDDGRASSPSTGRRSSMSSATRRASSSSTVTSPTSAPGSPRKGVVVDPEGPLRSSGVTRRVERVLIPGPVTDSDLADSLTGCCVGCSTSTWTSSSSRSSCCAAPSSSGVRWSSVGAGIRASARSSTASYKPVPTASTRTCTEIGSQEMPGRRLPCTRLSPLRGRIGHGDGRTSRDAGRDGPGPRLG